MPVSPLEPTPVSEPISRPVCVDVALDVPLRQLFSYTYETAVPAIGARVKVPFGRRKMVGVVVAHGDILPEHYSLKPIDEVLEASAIFEKEFMQLIDWVAAYYHAPIGEVWRTAMPKVLKQGLPQTHGVLEIVYHLNNSAEALPESLPKDWQALIKRAPLQQKVMALIQAEKSVSHASLIKALPTARNAVLALLEKGWLKQTELLASVTYQAPKLEANTLTTDQQLAYETLYKDLGRFQCSLLAGVTGSGKTEVYFHLIDAVLAKGKQVLVMLPEIALTDQHYDRFAQRFGSCVAQIHSGMSDAKRYKVWDQIRRGEIKIILGTRSSVFMLFKSLALIIIDEEHDLSYKQQEGIRYHARSVAIKRAQLGKFPVVLGTATPALETLQNVETKRFKIVTLKKRAQAAVLPDIELVDMNQQPVESGLSLAVTQAIEQCLANKQQALVFINRRGYAPVLFCPACQWTAECKRCDAQMTTHQYNQRMQCHHCGAIRRAPERCEACDETGLISLGEGTQKIEETLARLFPSACIQRFDRDELNSAKKLQAAMAKVHSKEIDILVGTQLLSKGHDFSNVNLGVVINADQGLHSIDFRAPEQLVQQLIQVAGRAGRGEVKGKVLIQTQLPQHPALLAVRTHDYSAFAKQELSMRKLAQFPPFSHIALWRVRGRDANQVMQYLQALTQIGRQHQPANTFCFDPVKSPMFKRGGQYHAQLLITAEQRLALHQWLGVWVAGVENMRSKVGVKWSLDVDPVSLF